VKLSKAIISWLVRGLQQVLFPQSEACRHSPLTDKEQQHISVLELVQIEGYVSGSARVDYLYDLMDAAYHAGSIYEVSRRLGHVPIIDKNSRGKRYGSCSSKG
jgi:hypothetical protein